MVDTPQEKKAKSFFQRALLIEPYNRKEALWYYQQAALFDNKSAQQKYQTLKPLVDLESTKHQSSIKIKRKIVLWVFFIAMFIGVCYLSKNFMQAHHLKPIQREPSHSIEVRVPNTQSYKNQAPVSSLGQLPQEGYSSAPSSYAYQDDNNEQKRTNFSEYLIESGIQSSPYEMERLKENAQNNDPQAQYELAIHYDTGKGVHSNDKKAVYWWTRAADNGHPYAMCKLGWMYEGGHSVKHDIRKAIALYSRAADMHIAWGQYNMGRLYEHGKGVEYNLNKAIELYKMAANQGNDYAKEALIRLQQ